MPNVQQTTFDDFKRSVLTYYREHGRHDLPWRQPASDGSLDPYAVLVSEIMLQQTQVPRVVPKFEEFMQRFPNVAALAGASLAEVLQAWNGLGYNRRAKFLWQAAQVVAGKHGGRLPRTTAELTRLPGIGPNTAGALLAYAYNQPVVFIETNIRTAFIHYFFADRTNVADRDIVELVAATVPEDARQWYWALMDYGTHLKRTIGNLNTLSKQYTKQSAFNGSRRQIRGQIVKALAGTSRSKAQLRAIIHDERLDGVLEDLLREGLISLQRDRYTLPRAVL